jgi:DNA repair protein RecN (Recombination protein N)
MLVITGETGVGKTLVTSAIDLLLGGRASADIVGRFDEVTTIEGILELRDGRELVVRREVTRAGRSRSFRDGALATASELREILGDEVEIFGQSLAQSLSRPAFQLRILDRFGGIDTTDLDAQRAELGRTERALAEGERRRSDDERMAELARYERDELERAELVAPDEDDALIAEIAIGARADEVRSVLAHASGLLGGDQGGTAIEQAGIARSLVEKSEIGTDLVVRLDAVVAELEDLHRELEERLEAIDADPQRLEEAQRRLAVLTGLKRKFNRTLTELLAYRDELRLRTDPAQQHEALEALRRTRDELRAQVASEEERVREARSNAALGLVAAVGERLPALGLERARIECRIAEQGDGSPVELLFSANPGSSPAPLRMIASGGELSRVMLALSLVSGADATTLIFDEVDAGVGGETALKVGQALREVGSDHQVVVVTHLAQVAAFADQHLVVEKTSDATSTLTSARVLSDPSERVKEIARMLSGQRDSGAAQRHAEELLTLGARTQ